MWVQFFTDFWFLKKKKKKIVFMIKKQDTKQTSPHFVLESLILNHSDFIYIYIIFYIYLYKYVKNFKIFKTV